MCTNPAAVCTSVCHTSASQRCSCTLEAHLRLLQRMEKRLGRENVLSNLGKSSAWSAGARVCGAPEPAISITELTGLEPSRTANHNDFDRFHVSCVRESRRGVGWGPVTNGNDRSAQKQPTVSPRASALRRDAERQADVRLTRTYSYRRYVLASPRSSRSSAAPSATAASERPP